MTQSTDTKTRFESGTRFTQRFLDDLRDSRLPQHIRRDFQDTYRFFLDDEERTRLDAMGTFKRSLFSSGYLIRSLVLKLSPARRLMLLLGIVLVVIGIPAETAQIVFGVLCLLFVLGLELKDKLLAKDELAEGRAVQIALMPTEHPSLPGWETWLFSAPANDVGGDLVRTAQPDALRFGGGGAQRLLSTCRDLLEGLLDLALRGIEALRERRDGDCLAPASW